MRDKVSYYTLINKALFKWYYEHCSFPKDEAEKYAQEVASYLCLEWGDEKLKHL